MWIYCNIQIDLEEKIESMCDSCKEDVQDANKCIRCGDSITSSNIPIVNRSFDDDLFNKLAGDIDG